MFNLRVHKFSGLYISGPYLQNLLDLIWKIVSRLQNATEEGPDNEINQRFFK